MQKKVVIIGAPHGQDAFLLAKYFKIEGYLVIGVGNPDRKNRYQDTYRREESPFTKVHYLDLSQKEVCNRFLDWALPTRIIHAAALHANSNEMISFSEHNKDKILSVEVQIPKNVMDWQVKNRSCRYLHLNSSQIFGNFSGMMNSESPTSPLNIYSEAKLEAFHLVKDWQNKELDVRSAILFPHSSPFSNKTFLLQEIAMQLVRIIKKEETDIILRNAEIKIDISDARELMHNVFNFFEFQSEITNCVFGSGKLIKISTLVEKALERLDLTNCRIFSREPSPHTLSYASSSEMLQKTPNFLQSRDVSLTIQELVARGLIH
jgi:GDP-D-mannose dehydratase